MAEKLSGETGISKEDLFDYVKYKISSNNFEETYLNEDRPFDEAVKNQLKEEIKKVLAELSENEQSIITSVYWEGKSISDIARARKISRQWVNRALIKTKLKLKNPKVKNRLRSFTDDYDDSEANPNVHNEVVVYPEAELSPREKTLLTLTIEGLSRKKIAEQLSIAESTASRIAEIIIFKLQTKSTFDCAIKAMSMGILDVSEMTKGLNKKEPMLEKLSTRELMILDSFANGMTYRKVDESLPSHALKRGLMSIRKKLELNTFQSVLLYIDAKKRNALLYLLELSNLSDKGEEIFKLIIQACSRGRILETSGITEKVLRYQLIKIFDSFSVSTLTELLIKLVNMKIIDPYKYLENVKKTDSNFLKNVDIASDISSLLPKITKREMDVLDALVASKSGSDKEIADSLHIALGTLGNHLFSISRKLGGANQEHVIMWYMAAKKHAESKQASSSARPQ